MYKGYPNRGVSEAADWKNWFLRFVAVKFFRAFVGNQNLELCVEKKRAQRHHLEHWSC